MLWKAASSGRITPTLCQQAVEELHRSGIQSLPTQPLLKYAAGIALAFDRPVYDATYLALAVQSGFPLLTADERLANAMSAYFPIRWLGAVI